MGLGLHTRDMRSRKRLRDKKVAFSITAAAILLLLVVLVVFLTSVALKVRQKTLDFAPTSPGSPEATVTTFTEHDQAVRPHSSLPFLLNSQKVPQPKPKVTADRTNSNQPVS